MYWFTHYCPTTALWPPTLFVSGLYRKPSRSPAHSCGCSWDCEGATSSAWLQPITNLQQSAPPPFDIKALQTQIQRQAGECETTWFSSDPAPQKPRKSNFVLPGVLQTSQNWPRVCSELHLTSQPFKISPELRVWDRQLRGNEDGASPQRGGGLGARWGGGGGGGRGAGLHDDVTAGKPQFACAASGWLCYHGEPTETPLAIQQVSLTWWQNISCKHFTSSTLTSCFDNSIYIISITRWSTLPWLVLNCHEQKLFEMLSKFKKNK